MSQNDEKIKMIREESIPKVLLKLGMPIIVGMMVSALYNLVDAFFVGGLGTSQMGAVSVVFPLSQIIIGLGMTFGSGAASYISRLLGEGNDKQANRTASTAILSSLFIGAISIVFTLCYLDKILIILGSTETILPYARAYAFIYIGGSIINIFNVTMNNMLTSEGAAKLTMISMLLGGVINAILDPIFIYPLGWGVQGAAIATVVAQFSTALFYIWYIFGKKGYLKFSIKYFTFDKTIYCQIFKIGIPLLIFQLMTSFSIGLTNTAARDYGDSVVATTGVITRVLAIGTFIVFGYMKGFQPVAGYNYGAKNYDRLNNAIRVSLIWSTGFCVFIALILVVFPVPIISMFSKNDTTMIDIGSRALRANGIMFAFFGFQMLYGSLFLALGKAKEGALLSMSRQGIFFIPIILVLPRVIGLDGVIYAQPVADFITTVLTGLLAVRLHKELRNAKSVDNKKWEHSNGINKKELNGAHVSN